MYYIKDKDGHTRFTTSASDTSNGYYWFLRKNEGYAEVWHNEECVLKTRQNREDN